MKAKNRYVLVQAGKSIDVVEIHDINLETITDLLKCKYVQCVKRLINGVVYHLYADEEALLTAKKLVPAVFTKHYKGKKILEVIYNNVLIGSVNKDGDITGLTKKEVDNILLNAVFTFNDCPCILAEV